MAQSDVLKRNGGGAAEKGTARLRMSLTLNVEEGQVAALATALAEELKRLDA